MGAIILVVASVLGLCLVEQLVLQLLIGTGALWQFLNVIFAIGVGWAGGKILAEFHESND